MKRLTYTLCLLFFSALFSRAQNLVPNGGFESYSMGGCPTSYAEFAFPWQTVTGQGGTPDFFHTCVPISGTPMPTVPDNNMGYQQPASGNGYMGLIGWTAWLPPNSYDTREYLQVQLGIPLQSGRTYRVSLQCALGNYYYTGTYPVTTDALGIYLSPNAPVANPPSNYGLLPLVPQYQPLVTMNEGSWTQIAFDYLAMGGESFLTIGNFKSDASTIALPTAPTGSRYYFYIDDVSVVPIRPVTVSGNTTICLGGNTRLTAADGLNYRWMASDAPGVVFSTGASVTVSPTQTTTYTVYGGRNDSAKITVRVNLSPVLDLSNDIISCANELQPLRADGNAVPLPGTAYVWQDGSTQATFLPTQSGVYWVRAQASGCTASDTIRVTVEPTPDVDLGADRGLCPGDTFVLDAGTAGATYRWQDQTTAATYEVTGPGTYRVEVTLGNCRDVDSLSVTASPVPVFDLGNDIQTCEGQPVQLDATVPGALYRWQDNSTDATFIPAESGRYRVWVTLGACMASDSVDVQIDSLPQVNIGADTSLCEDHPLVLDGTRPGLSYRWQDGATGGSYTVTRPGTYVLEVTDGNGCKNKDAIKVAFIAAPHFDFPDSTLCYGDVWVLDITATNAVYLWQDKSVLPTFTVMHAGTYRAEAHNSCGSEVDSVEVGYRRCNCQIYVPDSFTPEGNGINEQFIAWQNEECTLTQYEFTVFDRWGRVVFETRNIQQGWDGKIDGRMAPVDVYAYRMLYKFDKTPLKADRGSIVLVR